MVDDDDQNEVEPVDSSDTDKLFGNGPSLVEAARSALNGYKKRFKARGAKKQG